MHFFKRSSSDRRERRRDLARLYKSTQGSTDRGQPLTLEKEFSRERTTRGVSGNAGWQPAKRAEIEVLLGCVNSSSNDSRPSSIAARMAFYACAKMGRLPGLRVDFCGVVPRSASSYPHGATD
jgi:hypothetical protein